MRKEELYKENAEYYDLLYHNKNYRKESQNISKLISKYKKTSGKELLDVACGTGNHLKYLHQRYKCTGLDLNKGMLDIAKKKVPSVKYVQGNMINFNLHKEFDIITCLFSSIGYVKTYKNLHKTLANFSKHLKKGGVVIIHPWFSKKNFPKGKPSIATYEGENLKISRVNSSCIKNNISIIDFHYLIAENNKPVKYTYGRHELGLFDIKKTLEIMKSIGLKTIYIENKLVKGRGLFVGVKQ
jgi:ubiquinone/menaquinone biosynthesis C-methylase UbiE